MLYETISQLDFISESRESEDRSSISQASNDMNEEQANAQDKIMMPLRLSQVNYDIIAR